MSEALPPRLLGRINTGKPGALVIAVGALHGNEPAGVKAVMRILELLEKELENNPAFSFYGQFVGLLGNRTAYAAQQRFVDRDLNRLWTKDQMRRIVNETSGLLQNEDKEAFELVEFFRQEFLHSKPQAVVLLDLHTTSADGGIFCIPANDSPSLRLAKSLGAPVVLGLFENIEGTLLNYAVENHMSIGSYPQQTLGVAFEAGQHDDPDSVDRALATIVYCLRAAGCLGENAFHTREEDLMRHYGEPLPKVTRLVYKHLIKPGDGFKMKPGYGNFQAVEAGEHLADDAEGPIFALFSGHILMPLYQTVGSDGFFIVELVSV